MDELIRQLSTRYGVSEATLRERAGPELERLRASLGGGELGDLLRRPEFAGVEATLTGMFAGTPLAGIAGSFGLGSGAHEAGAGNVSEVEQAAERERDAAYAVEDGAAAPDEAGLATPVSLPDEQAFLPDGEGRRAPFMAGEGDAEIAENVRTDATLNDDTDLPAEGPSSPGRDDADAPADARERRG